MKSLREAPRLPINTEASAFTGNAKQLAVNAYAISTLIESIPALVAYIDCNMELQYCNQRFGKWFSLDSNAVGKNFPLVAGRQVFEQLQRHMGKVLVGDQAQFQICINNKEGVQYLDATLSPDFDHRNRVRGFIFHSSDVTEQNRTERALKDYFENASVGLHWVDADGIIKWANPAELKMLGYSKEEYFGHHISEFHADKSMIEDMLFKLSNKQAIKNYDADLVCKDRSIRHVTINSTVLWEEGKFIHTRCFTIDVTEKKRAAKAVRESEERFRMMAGLVPLIIWSTDEYGSCIFLSEKWQQITGCPAEEGLGDRWQNLIHPEDRQNIRESWTRSVGLRKPFEAKFRFLNSTGRHHVTFAHSTPRYDASGNFAGYIGILQDISTEEEIKLSLEKIVMERTEDLRKKNSDLRSAEEALQKKNQELEQINNQLESFAHIASHDLQEPLRKIQAFSNRLFQLEGEKFSEKGKELYKKIHDSSDRMKNLIQDLLIFSRSSDNENKEEEVHLNALLSEVVSELEIEINEKKATVESRDLPTLRVVKFQFLQLFLNLIGNALKFTKQGTQPHITVSYELTKPTAIGPAGTTGPHHHIKVADNGIGFDQVFSGKIFQMFHRLHGRTEFEGTGIGLAICKKIIEKHGGVIAAEGKPGVGATFHIFLPALIRRLSTE